MKNACPRVLRFLTVAAILSTAFASTAFGQNGDLGVSKTGPFTIEAGTDATYTVIVTNVSDEESTPTNTLTDVLPPNMTFVSATIADGWSCMLPSVGSAGTITCTYENPIVGGEAVFSFTFVFHLDSGVPEGTIVDNTASIAHEGEDPNSPNNSSTWSATVGAPPPPPLAPRDVLISEFRLSGPGGAFNGAGPAGARDEFIELYCNRDTNCDIGNHAIQAHDPNLGDFTVSFPPGTVIPARQYLLVADLSQYSLSNYATPDFDVNTAKVPDFFIDNEGIQFRSPVVEDPVVIDSVGFIGGGNSENYIEGTGLERATGPRPPDQYAYVRKRTLATSGLPQDTDNNAEDFVLVSVTGTAHTGITAPPVLGAPGPQSLTSARTYSNSLFTASLVEPGVPNQSTPNWVRTGSGDSGTLSIRRAFTNNTGNTVDYIAFRVIEIPTLNSPITMENQAELRLVTSPNAESFVNSLGRPVNILGTNLEFDAGSGLEPEQPNGGGLNSTVNLNLPAEPGFVDQGETVDAQFLLNVIRAGFFRFYIYVEARPFFGQGEVPGAATSTPTNSRVRSPAAPPRRFVNSQRTPAIKPKPRTSGMLKDGAGSTQTTSPAPVRFVIINRTSADDEKPARRKTRIRKKSSAALKKKAEEKYKLEKPEN